MKTQEAFKTLVDSPYLWVQAGGSKAARFVIRNRIAKGIYPSEATMEKYLKQSEYFKVKQERLWSYS